VVSAPYHRNVDGILDVHRLFLASGTEAREIAKRRELGLVVLCRALPGRTGHDWYLSRAGRDGLYAKLAAGDPPDWLVRLGVGDAGLAGFLVYTVDLGSL
jgi:hypothetical protein